MPPIPVEPVDDITAASRPVLSPAAARVIVKNVDVPTGYRVTQTLSDQYGDVIGELANSKRERRKFIYILQNGTVDQKEALRVLLADRASEE